MTLNMSLKVSQDSVHRQEDRETLLINQRADELKAASRCHGTTSHASAGTAAQHLHKKHDTVACEGILLHDNLLPLNTLQHKRRRVDASSIHARSSSSSSASL